MCTTGTAPRRWSSAIHRSATCPCTSIPGIRGPGPRTSAAWATCSTCPARPASPPRCTCGTCSRPSTPRRWGGGRTSSWSRPGSTPWREVERGLAPPRLREIVRAGEGELWVDVDSNDLPQHALLEKVFEFHTLAVEDTLSPRTRVKLEEYDRYVFVVMAGVQFDQATPDPFDLQTSNLYFFLGKNFLVTVHAVPSMGCDAARDRLLRSPDLLARG